MHKEQFLLEISNRFNTLEENKLTIETFHKIMEEEAERFGKNGKDKPNEKLKEDMEIERKLYKQKAEDQPTILTSSPDKEEIPPFLEEVKETSDEMKKKKAPGNDGITGDVMKIRAPQSGNQGQGEEIEADLKQDGWMTSEEQQIHNGRGRHTIGGNGRRLQRATSCSRWTKPPSNQV
ncbi:hypothetical protein PoB_006353100 [Plakobranchus ocellatus]|uniref:Uncharacterized protein n=1 Tax=Plakobranchus ocellatus TaxID=259542 RepID=A0AAV4CYY2_9GAST|nr:hypothetical protein PoB_006353100 [Plakobranchus ocellatus]